MRENAVGIADRAVAGAGAVGNIDVDGVGLGGGREHCGHGQDGTQLVQVKPVSQLIDASKVIRDRFAADYALVLHDSLRLNSMQSK